MNFWDAQVYRPEPPVSPGNPKVPGPLWNFEPDLEPWYRLQLCTHRPGEPLTGACREQIRPAQDLPSQMVVSVDSQIIGNHAEFFTAPFMEHVARLIGVTLLTVP